ncbi:MAG: hypothetical protein R6V53_02225 [Candidatus Woesearchaeota archaeon]
MNFMIKELTKSGMVTSFEDAIDKASNLYANAMPEEREEVKTQSQPQQSQVEPQTQAQTQSQPNLDLLERKFTNTMKQNNQAIANEMKKIWEELQSLKKQSMQAQVQAQSQNQAQNQTQQKPAQPESHPRQGDFTPTSVDLEQYFYYGKR